MKWYKSIGFKIVLIVVVVIAVVTLVLSLLYLKIQRVNLEEMAYRPRHAQRDHQEIDPETT